MTESPSSSGSTEDTGDLESALAAIQRRDPSGPIPRPPAAEARSASDNRRAALGLALVALLVGGVIHLLTATPDPRGEPNTDSRAGVVFANAAPGACLSWPSGSPDQPSFVQCRDDHLFEVAKSVDMSHFGEPCQAAVRSYLGSRYDPNSRFTIGVLWAGDAEAGRGSRNLLCGLQLLGVDGAPTPFRGSVAELDQSKVWLPGTCLGIDGATRQSTDIPVDCNREHAVEVVGSVGLAERFPGVSPPEPEQDAFIRDVCTRLTEEYLAPIPLQVTGLTLTYSTLPPASWSAGSRQVSCGLVSPGEQGLRPLVGTVRGAGPGDQVAPPAPPSPEPSPPPSPEPPPPPSAAPSTTTTTPATTSAPSTTPSSPSSVPSTTSTPPPGPLGIGPPPGPEPGEPLPEPTPQPGVILVPGLPPITLPGFAPPPPPPPAP